MLNKYDLSKSQRKILNNQIIENYCYSYNIKVNYDITPEF